MKKSMKRMVVVMAILMVVIAAGIGLAEPLKGAITGSFVGTSGAYTNTTGAQIQLTAVVLAGTMSSSTNAYIKVTSGSDTWILYQAGATNNIAWYSGAGGFNLQRDGIVAFYAPSSATATNRYRIEGR